MCRPRQILLRREAVHHMVIHEAARSSISATAEAHRHADDPRLPLVPPNEASAPYRCRCTRSLTCGLRAPAHEPPVRLQRRRGARAPRQSTASCLIMCCLTRRVEICGGGSVRATKPTTEAAPVVRVTVRVARPTAQAVGKERRAAMRQIARRRRRRLTWWATPSTWTRLRASCRARTHRK